MSNFTIHFSCAWLLFVLIPVLFLALFPHFRVAKKYRRTRNRITALVLHCVILVLSVLVLSGITFEYDVPNDENEILLLVDVSHSSSETEQEKNNFIKSVIDFGDDDYKIGIVTFGYDQVYAAPLSYDGDDVYNSYLNAKKPDTSGTDFEAALIYARSLLKYPKTSKIVIISDGFETDGNAASVIRSIAADGVHVDTRYFHQDAADDIQLINVELPESTLVVDSVFDVSLTMQSSYSGGAEVTMYDNGVVVSSNTVNFVNGVQNVSFKHSFSTAGMHVLTFSITAYGDTLVENNVYKSYIYLETFDKLLILESNEGESANLVTILENAGFNVNVIDIHNDEDVPDTLSALCAYDEIIMMNIANSDMPVGFDEILNSYVYDVGGGMFTVGGDKIGDDGVKTANAYNREDMIGTLYQSMLPVQAVDYTPPLGLVIIIDRSGSMTVKDSYGKTRLDAAKDGAYACLDVLNDRDWCGVISLDTDFEREVELTRATQKTIIRESIDQIGGPGGGTKFSPAIIAAGNALKQNNAIAKKHIILVTDGEPSSSDIEAYEKAIEDNLNAGITLSVVGIGVGETGTTAERMKSAAEKGNGNFISVTENFDTLRNKLRDELTMNVIQQYVPEEFEPIKRSTGDAAWVGIPLDTPMPVLGGYYGTRVKSTATNILVGEYEVPVYSHWKYGAGMVGSFMSDLRGTADSWSSQFMNSDIGIMFITNVIKSLFPKNSIRPTDIGLELNEQNYRTQMSIFTELNSDEKINVTVSRFSDDGLSEEITQTISAGINENYSRVTFTTMDAGVYKVLVEKVNSQNEVISSAYAYKVFSYSKEFDVFIDSQQGYDYLASLSSLGQGDMLDDASDVYIGFVDKLHKVVDPRLAMIIIALILFLLEIAVRKFKFKWPHELIRDYRSKNKS